MVHVHRPAVAGSETFILLQTVLNILMPKSGYNLFRNLVRIRISSVKFLE
jgi:hypothetical protein